MKLATAFVAFSISAYSAEVFYVKTLTTTYPVTPAADFNAVDGDGNLTNPYNIYGTTDAGNGAGVAVVSNFNGSSSAINPGDQITNGSNTTTYFGPKFYAGINRDAYRCSGGVIHSNGNGYRIRFNNVTASDIGTPQVGTAQVGEEGDLDYVAASPDYVAATGT